MKTSRHRYSSIILFILVLSFFLQGCLPYVSNIVDNTKFTWVQDSSQHFHYYIKKTLWSQSRIDSIKNQAEADFTLVMQKLGEKKYPHMIHYFVVSDYKESAELTLTRPEIQIGDTLGYSYFYGNWMMVTHQQKSYSHSQHQLVKIIANNLYGVCSLWVDEGLGLYINNSFKGYDLHELAAYLQKHQQPLFSSPWGAVSGFPQIGSLFKYIAENYGIRYIYELCRTDGTSTYIFGDIISEWRKMLNEKYVPLSSQNTIQYPLKKVSEK